MDSRKIKIKVQAGNHNKRVMQPQLYQMGRNFKPIFIVDIARDKDLIAATHARRQIGSIVYKEVEEDKEEKEERGNKFKQVTVSTLECIHTKRVTDQNVLYFREEV